MKFVRDFRWISLLASAFSLTACSDSGQLEALKQWNVCESQTLGEFVEGQTLSYEWQDMKTKDYGDVVGFLIELKDYREADNPIKRLGVQAKYEYSSVSKGYEFTPVAMEIFDTKTQNNTIVPPVVIENTLRSYCKGYKKLDAQEEFLNVNIEPGIHAAQIIKRRIDYCSEPAVGIGKYPQHADECSNVFRSDSNEKGIGEVYTDNKDAHAEFINGQVVLTFLSEPIKGQTLIYESLIWENDETGQSGTAWYCVDGTLDHKYMPKDCDPVNPNASDIVE